MLNFFRATYIIAVCTILLGLAAELYLRFERNGWKEEVQSFSEQNYFLQKENRHAFNSLWEIPWQRYKANSELSIKHGEQNLNFKINSLGFRDKEFSVEKAERVFRILCIGASTTAQGHTNDQTYPAILEKKLHALGHKQVEVLNLGISGTPSEHWLYRFDQLLSYSPDLVIQYNGVNDIVWKHLEYHAVINKFYKIRQHSLLLTKIFPIKPELLNKYLQKTLNNFLTMHFKLKDKGIPYLSASFAGPDYRRAPSEQKKYLDLNLETWRGKYSKFNHYRDYAAVLQHYNNRFVKFSEKHNILAAYPHLEISNPSLFIDIAHMTPEGIENLADVFLAKILVPERESVKTFIKRVRRAS